MQGERFALIYVPYYVYAREGQSIRKAALVEGLTGTVGKYTGGLWVGKFTKTVTYQKVSAEGTEQVAPAAAAISDGEFMFGHALTCRMREERVKQRASTS